MARGNYVRRSIRIEDGGIPTVKISDYDIYVITSGINSKRLRLFWITWKIYFLPERILTGILLFSFINDDIKIVNKYLEEGRYFYTQIKQEGIVLYNEW